MKLSNHIVELGRAVAFYPGLKKITGSTTATILLCQFLYWSDKSQKNNGWTYKNYKEIEYETGLTRNEQKTAKRILAKKGLLSIQRKRLDHNSGYKVNQEVLNELWETVSGEKSKPIFKVAPVDEIPPVPEPPVEEENHVPEMPVDPGEEFAKEMLKESQEKGVTTVKLPAKKGDIIDGMVAARNSAGMEKMYGMKVVRDRIEEKFCVNPDGKRWEDFIEYAYNMQKKNNQNIDRFIVWAIDNGFNPVYWTPEKMRTLWPQAFVENKANQPRADFVAPLPPRKEEKEIAPMPKELGRERKLF
jgi:hypothetical protein